MESIGFFDITVYLCKQFLMFLTIISIFVYILCKKKYLTLDILMICSGGILVILSLFTQSILHTLICCLVFKCLLQSLVYSDDVEYADVING